jgi:hypothetical protein
MNYFNYPDAGLERQSRMLEEAEQARLAKQVHEGEEKESLRHRIGMSLVKLGKSLSEPTPKNESYSDYKI